MDRFHAAATAFVVPALVILALVGCSGNPLLGKWTGNCGGEAIQLEFRSDGTVIDGSFAARYSVIDDHRLEIEVPIATEVFTYSVSGDALTLSTPEPIWGQSTTCTLRKAS